MSPGLSGESFLNPGTSNDLPDVDSAGTVLSRSRLTRVQWHARNSRDRIPSAGPIRCRGSPRFQDTPRRHEECLLRFVPPPALAPSTYQAWRVALHRPSDASTG